MLIGMCGNDTPRAAKIEMPIVENKATLVTQMPICVRATRPMPISYSPYSFSLRCRRSKVPMEAATVHR